jgi:hypothetical protein
VTCGSIWNRELAREDEWKRFLMSDFKPNTAAGTDWTGLLADPDLARNLGKLLQTYRDAPPERRE